VDSIDGTTLSVSDNLARAQFLGNDATNTVAIDNDKSITLTGSAGVSNYQANLFFDAGADPFVALVGDDPSTLNDELVIIEVGDWVNGVGLADLTGSTIDFIGNDVAAIATANTAVNTVALADGLNLAGSATTADQSNAAIAGLGSGLKADLFIQNLQATTVGSAANVGHSFEQPSLAVTIEDSANSRVTADENSIFSSATGSNVSNTIDVGDTAVFSGLVGINSVQLNSAQQSASIFSGIEVDVASSVGDGSVTASGLTVDGNDISAQAIANSQSSSFALTGTDVSGLGVLAAQGIIVDRPSGTDLVAADFSLLNAQLMDSDDVIGLALAGTTVNTQILVEIVDQAGAAGSEFFDSSLSVSGNSISSLAIGNISSEAGISVDATTFTGTVAVVNDQTVLDEAVLNADLQDQGDALINVLVTPELLSKSSISADGNSMSSRVWANLADASTNEINVTGVTVTDGDTTSIVQPFGNVERDATFVTSTTVGGGFILLNDQSVEDLDDAVAQATTDFSDYILVELGGDTIDSVISDIKATASDNSGLTSVTLNQATSAATIQANSLNSSTALVNVQTLADKDDDGISGDIFVEAVDNDIQIEPESGTAGIVASTLQINKNSLAATGRVNLADNSIAVTAQTMTIEGVDVAALTQAAELGDSTFGSAEVLLVNDQFIDSLIGIDVAVIDTDLYIEADANDGSLVSSTLTVDGNRMLALAAGNDASNEILLKSGTFDLSLAAGGGPLTGPVATIASNQSGEDGENSISAFVGDRSDVYIDLLGIDGAIAGSKLSVSGNALTALARTNNVTNELKVSGTTFDNVTSSTPVVGMVDAGGGADVLVNSASFSIASRQINDYDVEAEASNIYITIEAYDSGSVEDSSLTVDKNVVSAEARGNDSANSATTDFTTNGAQTFIANAQFATGSDPEVRAGVDGVFIIGDVNDAIGVPFTDSSVSVSQNALQALASGNRTANTLSATGTNIVSGSGAAPSSTVEQGGAPDLLVTADFGIVNAQGSRSLGDNADDSVVAIIESDTDDTGIEGGIDVFISGSLRIDNNLMLAQGIDNSAVNSLSLKASANVGLANDTSGATIVSQQLLSDDNSVEVDILDTSIGAGYYGIEDMSDAASASVSVQNNQMIGQAIGGIAINTLAVTAGANILGGAPAPITGMGDVINDPLTLSADFSVLNVQLTAASDGDDQDIDSEIDGDTNGNPFDDIAVRVNSDIVNDTITVDNNIVSSGATGLIAENRVILSAGASSEATAQLANLQGNGGDGSSTDIGGDVFDITIRATILGSGLDASSLSVSNNTVEGRGTGNTAVNIMSSTVGATLQESSGAGVSIASSATTPITVSGADYSILNHQYVDSNGGLIRGGVDNVIIGADDMSGATGVNDSTVAVNGNDVLASATGNNAVNLLVLNTGTFQHPSAAIAGSQRNSDVTISAEVSNVTIGIGVGGGTINASSDNSSFSVRGNNIGATAIGNSGSNFIRSK
jgi:hypothetical protein